MQQQAYWEQMEHIIIHTQELDILQVIIKEVQAQAQLEYITGTIAQTQILGVKVI